MDKKEAIFRKFGVRDVILMGALAVFLTGGSVLFFALTEKRTGSMVVVTVDGEETGRYPLDQDQEISIKNSGGKETNRLRIAENKAVMIDADCPDGLCMHQRAIFRENENIVCLPNRVVVTVTGGNESSEESPVDVIAE